MAQSFVQEIVLVIHVVMALVIIGLVLLQHGKGADMGAAFGSGSAGSLFGASGASNFLSKATAICATVFFVTSLSLTFFTMPNQSSGVMSGHKTEQKVDQKADPKAPATAPAPAAPAKADESKSKDIPK
jgi:preprotein translocase subunit SecG